MCVMTSEMWISLFLITLNACVSETFRRKLATKMETTAVHNAWLKMKPVDDCYDMCKLG